VNGDYADLAWRALAHIADETRRNNPAMTITFFVIRSTCSAKISAL
jgi:hypothetical protein